MWRKLQSALTRLGALPRALGTLPGCYLAGGWLRDAAWGCESSDFDFAVAGDMQPALDLLSAQTGQQPFLLNARFESYGFAGEGYRVDVLPLHADGPEADARRRDYSVNSLLIQLCAIDQACRAASEADFQRCFTAAPGAWDDLAQRRLRQLSPENLRADPLRILRGYRLMSHWQLSVESATRGTWRELAGLVCEPAAERLHEEVLKLLAQPPAAALRIMAEDAVLWQLFPPLAATQGCDQTGYHHLDVWEHTLLAMEKLEWLRRELPPSLQRFEPGLSAAWSSAVSGMASAGTLTRLALLLHDIAKPPTRQLRPDGRASFYGHQDVGVRLVQPLLQKLKFSAEEQDFVLLLIREHMRLGYYSEPSRLNSKLVYRFLRRLGPAAPLMVLHTLADCAATQGPLSGGAWERHVLAAETVLNHFYSADNVARPRLLLDGNAIMQLTGIRPGPIVGQLKTALLEATAAGEVQSADEAAALVLRLAADPAALEVEDQVVAQ